MGRVKLPEGKKRVRVFGRVDPATVEFFKSLDQANDGRAMDRAAVYARAMQAGLKVIKEAEPPPSGSV